MFVCTGVTGTTTNAVCAFWRSRIYEQSTTPREKKPAGGGPGDACPALIRQRRQLGCTCQVPSRDRTNPYEAATAGLPKISGCWAGFTPSRLQRTMLERSPPRSMSFPAKEVVSVTQDLSLISTRYHGDRQGGRLRRPCHSP